MASPVSPFTPPYAPIDGSSPSAPIGRDRFEDWTDAARDCHCLVRIGRIFIDAIAYLIHAFFDTVLLCVRMINPLASQTTHPRASNMDDRPIEPTRGVVSFEAVVLRREEIELPCTDPIAPSPAQQEELRVLREQIRAVRTRMAQSGIRMEWTSEALEYGLLHLDNAGDQDCMPLAAIKALLRRQEQMPSASANQRTVLYTLNQILESCLANKEFFTSVVLCANEMSTDCEDRVETFFAKIRLQWELQCNPEMREPANLGQLLIGIERVHLIEEHVRAAFPIAEQLEILLYAFTQLKRALGLPDSTPEQMAHAEMGRISNDRLTLIREGVLARTTSSEDKIKILCAESLWNTLVWNQFVDCNVKDLIDELNASVVTGSDENGDPYVFLDVLRMISREVSSQALGAMLGQLVACAPDPEREEREAQMQRVQQITASWEPVLNETDAPLEEQELQSCRSLLAILIMLGMRFNHQLPHTVDDGGILALTHLLTLIKGHYIKESTALFLLQQEFA